MRQTIADDCPAPPPALLVPSRREALQRLVALVSMTGGLGACGAGDGIAEPSAGAPSPPPPAPPALAPAPPPPAAPPPAPPAPAPARSAVVQRLMTALQAPTLTVASRPVDVEQSGSQETTPLSGSSATMIPPWAPTGGFSSLADLDLTQLWGFRRDTWTRQMFPLHSLIPVSLDHQSASASCRCACGLHFVFDGQALELLVAGTGPAVVLLADGQYMSTRCISNTWSGGVRGGALSSANAFIRFDFGSRATRHVSVYAWSSQGPCSVAIPPGSTAVAWDRSSEPSMSTMADSYGQAFSGHWPTGGPFFAAADQLGIPHLDSNAIGGTGYAANNVFANPGDAFGGRIGSSTGSAPDLFLTSGGLNDNNWLALPPYASAADARQGFDAAVSAYYRDLRAALPDSVLAATGPWTPPRDPSPPDVVQAKVATIWAALQAVGGPWIFVDNVNGGWVNSAGASGPATGQRWQTGKGWEGAPANDGGNSDLYIGTDGTHPNEAGCAYLGGMIAQALREAVRTL